MGASSSAINPTQDFLARMGGGRLFEVGTSAVKYGIYISDCSCQQWYILHFYGFATVLIKLILILHIIVTQIFGLLGYVCIMYIH